MQTDKLSSQLASLYIRANVSDEEKICTSLHVFGQFCLVKSLALKVKITVILLIYTKSNSWGMGGGGVLQAQVFSRKVSKGETFVITHNKLTNVPGSVKMHLLVQLRHLKVITTQTQVIARET